MLGSVSHHAVLYAPCSTRVGRYREGCESALPTAPVRIIVGWDGSDDAAAALRATGARHWPAGSRVRLVTALDLSLATALPAIIPAELIAVGFPPVVDDQSDALQEGMRIAAEHLRASGLVVEDPVMRCGDPKHVLIDEARTWPADCIFIGARGLSNMHRVLLGSVASRGGGQGRLLGRGHSAPKESIRSDSRSLGHRRGMIHGGGDPAISVVSGGHRGRRDYADCAVPMRSRS